METTAESITNPLIGPRMLGSASLAGGLHAPLTCTSSADLSQQAYAGTGNYSGAATYSHYATDSYMSAAKAAVASRPTPYSRNMDYPTYHHPRMNGLYQRPGLGTYGYETR